MKPFENQTVANKFASYPGNVRDRMHALRSLIFRVASNLPEVGAIQETLKWGEPAYAPVKNKIGDTVPEESLAICIEASLTYHLRKRGRSLRNEVRC